MSDFKFTPLELEKAYLIENFYVGDKRGCFSKCFEKNIFREHGIEFNVDETFMSVSARNVIRGLHFQIHNPQAKLVTVLRGKALDVIVDLRMSSPTYKKWIGVELSEENHNALYIPRGFAHGFASLEDETIILYQCDGKYDKETDTGVLYNSEELNIAWPIEECCAIHSQRDLQLMSIEEYEKNPMKV